MYSTYIILITLLAPFVTEGQQTFTNPIVDRNSADPHVIKLGDFYYLSISENSEKALTIYKSPILTNFRNAPSFVALNAPPGCSDLWAPEIHLLDKNLYMYFTMRCESTNGEHRMWVIEARNPADPLADWADPIRLFPQEPNVGGIDGSILQHGNGQRYYLWTLDASIYIAPMLSPTVIGSPRVPINIPDAEWECNEGGCICEGPFVIYNKGVSYLVYSGSSSFDKRYALGVMNINSTQDPLIPANWNIWPDAVFYSNEEESVLGTGHASFTVSPDGTETWMVYHAHGNDSTPGRIARIEKITWDERDGRPIFPRPHGYNTPMPLPSGQKLTFTNPIVDRNSADPHVIKLGDFYYLSISENSEKALTIYKSPILTNFRNAPSFVALNAPPGCSDLWAPEIHLLDKNLYMYFTMRCESTNGEHRMWVIEARNPADPLADWADPIRLFPQEPNLGGIDGSILQHGNSQRYYLWTSDASIYIAPMLSPTVIGSPRVPINIPDAEWECNEGGCICEGPFVIYNKGVSYLVYSGSSSFDERYALGVMSINATQDPLVPENWYTWPDAVFYSNDKESVYGTGHASFTVSPDESETWMVYHAHGNDSTPGRIARIEKITWDERDGRPIFPRPHGYNSLQIVPSGQTSN